MNPSSRSPLAYFIYLEVPDIIQTSLFPGYIWTKLVVRLDFQGGQETRPTIPVFKTYRD